MRPSIISDGAMMSAPDSRVRQSLFRQQFERRVVLHILVFDHAAMPVRSVFAQTNVRNHEHFGKILFNFPRRFLHDSVRQRNPTSRLHP